MAKWAEPKRFFMDVVCGQFYLIETRDREKWEQWHATGGRPIPNFAVPIKALQAISFSEPAAFEK